MSKTKKKRKSSAGKRLLALLITLLCAFATYLSGGTSQPFEIHFLDVDQADCALVIADGKTMLIDGGNPGDGPKIIDYLRTQGVHKLDFLIATHPHSDHIGGLPYVVENIEITQAFISPFVHTSATYEELLDNLDKANVATAVPKTGQEFDLGGADCRVIANGGGFDDANDASIILRVAYGDVSALFTGDAEVPAEDAALASGMNLRSTILKVGHHGSETSSGQPFLDAVDPEIAVISCGKDNSYGHPHADTLKKLDCEVRRTDEEGTVVLASDGLTVTAKGETPVFKIYIGNWQSKKLHLIGCEYLPSFQNMDFFWKRSMAIDAGYVPCGSCKP